jgi:hypothetical protein
MRELRWQATLRGACALALCGCLTEQRYDVLGGEVELTEDMAPIFVSDEDDAVYRIDAPFELLITPPKDAELAQLTREVAGKTMNYPRLPWVALHDLALQLDYALTNLGAEPKTAMVFVDGVNEFQYYAPGPLDLHQWEYRVTLQPGQRVSGTITELELDEVAVDLATVINGAPNSNLVVDRNSQSSRDPRVKAFLPAVVPGLVGVRAGIETTEAAHVLLELTIRVSDLHDRAASRGKEHWMLPQPAAFTPIVPET